MDILGIHNDIEGNYNFYSYLRDSSQLKHLISLGDNVNNLEECLFCLGAAEQYLFSIVRFWVKNQIPQKASLFVLVTPKKLIPKSPVKIVMLPNLPFLRF